MNESAPATLPLMDIGEAPASTGHVRQRRGGTKRSLTTVEFTMAEREVLDRLAEETGSSRAAVIRDALRSYAAENGQPVVEEARTAA